MNENTNGTIGFCNSCIENCAVDDARYFTCSICGDNLVPLEEENLTTESTNTALESERGINQRKVGKDLLRNKALDRSKVKENSPSIKAIELEVNCPKRQLRIEGTLANFCNFPKKPFEGTIKLADPISCEKIQTVKGESEILLAERGKCKFLTKAKNAQISGASCLIIIQTEDIWPFVIKDDSSGEKISVPTVMVSQKDGKTMKELAETCDQVKCRVSTKNVFDECAICKDNFEIGSETISLKCSHIFHSHCVEEWLIKSTTCPMCRNDITKPISDKSLGNEFDDWFG